MSEKIETESTDNKVETTKQPVETTKDKVETAKKDNPTQEQVDFANLRKELIELSEELVDLKQETAKKKAKNSSIDKNGQEIKPKFKDSELSKRVPKDSLFNKLHHYNSGTTKSAIAVINKVDYFNFHYKNIKYTFWKGLALTKSQVKVLPKGYVDRICG